MLKGLHRGIVAAALAVALVASACDDSSSSTQPTPPPATPRPLPSPVAYRPDPQGIDLADPAFEALPGAQAEYGTLGGAVYRIEMPGEWNGRLVLYMHGFQGLAPSAEVETPSIRGYLIAHGFAWGGSSYSSTALIPGRAADETAALWDLFARKHGRPQFTYVTGHSMGGGATHIAAERYPDRYDGALGLCGFAGQAAISSVIGDFFLAGAYVAGVTQQEFDGSDVYELIDARIRPALKDPATHDRFINILLDLTGGPRAFDRRGFLLEEETNWERTAILTALHLYDNSDRGYALGGLSDVASADFDRGVLRVKPTDAERYANFLSGNEITGDIKLPLLTMHTTGDWQVPIDQQQVLRQKAEAAGKGDLLVQRIVRDAAHCAFTDEEWTTGLQDLIGWVEHGEKPAGEDVMVDDLRTLGGAFTLSPRFGTAEAKAVPGADKRLTLTGTITLNGAPFDGYTWAYLERDGLQSICYLGGDPAINGHYDLTLAADEEVRGCGVEGSAIYVRAFANGQTYAPQQPVSWQHGGGVKVIEITLTEAGQAFPLLPATQVYGTITRANGEKVQPGTVVEAYIGGVRCGVIGVPRVVMAFTGTDGYLLLVSGPKAVRGCGRDAPITLRVDGADVPQTATNNFDESGERVDIVVP